MSFFLISVPTRTVCFIIQGFFFIFLEILWQASLLSSMLERHIRKTSIHNLCWLLYTSYTANNCFPEISFCRLMSQRCGLVSVGYLPKEVAMLWFEAGPGIGERGDASSIYISVTNQRSRKLMTQTVLFISIDRAQRLQEQIFEDTYRPCGRRGQQLGIAHWKWHSFFIFKISNV